MHILLAMVWALTGLQAWAVIGGRAASSGDFPSVVKLQAGARVCSGTIVGPRTVVSAAHCATEDSPYFEYAGEKYPVRYVRSTSQDLALAITGRDIKGANAMKLGGRVKHGEPLANAGFGCTERGGRPGGLHIGFSKIIGMDEDHLLSVAKDGGALCEGDSGGPAIVRKDSEFYLVAVNSLSDIKHVNVTVRMDSEESRRFLKQAALDNRLEIPGL